MSLENSSNFLLNLSVRDVSGVDNQFFCFKSFRLNIAERHLLKDGVPVPLTPKVFDVLALLVERNGHLVEKSELLKTVWYDTFVEEANISRTIHELRKALGEDKNDKYIETVAKKGYRFVAEVTEIRASEETGAANGRHDLLNFVNLPINREIQLPNPQITEAVTLPKIKTKGKTWLILFGISFLSAVFLLFVAAFYLKSGSTTAPGNVRSIAVLPLKPINAGVRDEVYEIGIADSLIHVLGKSENFQVRPLSATRMYMDIAQDPVAAGREQKVDFVVAANYQLANGKIRVTSQLINVSTGRIENTFQSGEVDTLNVFTMQDDLAVEVGKEILYHPVFAPDSPGIRWKLAGILSGVRFNPSSSRFGTENEEAYRLYWQGKNLTAKRSGADAKKAIEYFEQAIRLDPNFALAFVGMAHAFSALGTLGGYQIQREVYEKAHAALNKAAELDANLADVYAVRGELKLKEWDFAGAENDLRKAIELEPHNNLAHGVYAMWLSHHGRFDESLAEIEIALENDPNSLGFQRERGRFLYFARRYDEAIVHLERVLEIDGNFATAFHWLILAYEKKGDYDRAFEWHLKEQNRSNPERLNDFQKAYETGGWELFKRKIIEFEKLEKKGNNYRHARQHALLNEKEQAFEYLNKALEKRQTEMTMLKVEPAFDSLRDDPRFDELLKRVGFK